MKLIASAKGDANIVLKELIQTGEPGIVVFPDGEAQASFSSDYSKEYFLGLTKNHPVSIIGTYHSSNNICRAWLHKKGLENLLQIFIKVKSDDGKSMLLKERLDYEEDFIQNDTPKNLSPTESPIMGLTRICADIYLPAGKIEPVDLVVAPTSASDNIFLKDLILEKMAHIIKPTTLFMIANRYGMNLTGIYNHKMEKVGTQKDNYYVHEI